MLRSAHPHWLVELVEVRQQGDSYRLVEFYVNPSQIVSVRDHSPSQHLAEQTSRIGLSEHIEFSTVEIKETAGNRRIRVVGSARAIYLKVNNRKGILKG
jgi:hypothetical protein